MSRFDCFVVFAEMRTGSNLLEAALNDLPGVTCHGEAFNPALIGYPKRAELLGVSREARDADPMALWARIKSADGLNGCRFFHDHDPRVLSAMLEDKRCAKIVLTRNPVESYVSLKLARSTGQWKLGDAKHRKDTPQAEFDAAEFEDHLASLQGFQIVLMNALQTSGQTAFYIDYEDAQDLEVLNGLASWLGVEGRLSALPSSLVVQNPEALEAKVANFAAMESALAKIDRFNLSRTPNFEPRRGPAVPQLVGCAAGLLYLPIRPGLDWALRDWLSKLGPLEESFSQKTLRQWKRKHVGHRSFTVVRHPLMRAHLAFAALLAQDNLIEIRDVLRRTYKLPLPEGKAPAEQDWAAGLLAFLGWLKANLNAQTSLPVHALWASQSAVVQGFAQFALPDLIAREDRLAEDLGYLARMVGVEAPALSDRPGDTAPVKLAEIWTPELEQAAADTYSRDYMQFGFGPWKRKKG